jgi:drug/metabolite transporter (DMT)-like permease
MQNNLLKGVLLVALGATSYGMLATYVKKAYNDGYTTTEVTASQFIYGILGVFLLFIFQKAISKNKLVMANTKNIMQLMLAGTSLGMTSVFYYLCVKYTNVSIAIVLLMQTVWMGVLIEWFLDKNRPNDTKILSVFLVLLGTALATKLYLLQLNINIFGLFWGLMAAASFTTTMFTANKIATHVSSSLRSLYMLLGGGIIVLVFCLWQHTGPFQFSIFSNYGIFLALFGTIIPPILLNAGFPKTGLGLGSIVSSLELPVSVLMAYFLLKEEVVFWQWIGILVILFAIFLMNYKLIKK